jgi:hypothetical protein
MLTLSVFKHSLPLFRLKGTPLWIRRLHSKFKFWLSQIYHPDSSGQFEKLGILESLDPLLFRNYKTVFACMYKFRSIYPNLDEYLKQIRYASYMLSEHKALENDWCKYSQTQVSLDSFLIGKNGRALDPVKSIALFKRSAIIFFHHYALIRNEQIDNDGHNARILAKFHNEILSLARILLRYSHHDGS